MISEKKVWSQLEKVIDPELNINIVDLGLIYEVKTQKNDVNILMTLTFPGCPLASIIHKEIHDKLDQLTGVGEVSLEITFDPPWDFSKVSDVAKEKLGII
jgi:metal-sulfur cluster biosynthetic enzyme